MRRKLGRRGIGIALAAAVIAGATAWWAGRTDPAPGPMSRDERVDQAAKVMSLWDPAARAAASVRHAVAEVPELVEPILVYADSEAVGAEASAVATAPLPHPGSNSSVAPRPEAGREPRRWMAYAEEDAALEARRKAACERLAQGSTTDSR